MEANLRDVSTTVFANLGTTRDVYVGIDESLSSLEAAPAWLKEIQARVNALRRLPADWDSYGASRISSVSALATYDLLQKTASPRTPKPILVPTADGSIQIEWHSRGIDLEIRVYSATKLDFIFDDHGVAGTPVEMELKYDLTPLRDAIAKLSTRQIQQMP